MNVHHLELFYYVVRHGGISRAARHMPYGIQQPAISGQIHKLEQDLSVRLFARTPFRLTPAGEELFAFVRPFFGSLDEMANRLRDRTLPQLRIGASELVLRDHLPAVIEAVRHKHPRLRLSLRSGYQAQFEIWLAEREIDLAITPLDSGPPARLRCQRLIRLPLVLLVHRKSGLKSAEELWQRNRLAEPLISLPPTESITRLFQTGLRKRKLEWAPAIVASSADLVARYVANGYGIGVSLDVPEYAHYANVRVLALDGFESVEIVALWAGRPSPLVAMVLAESRQYVARKWSQ